jgi:hypothetical protein
MIRIILGTIQGPTRKDTASRLFSYEQTIITAFESFRDDRSGIFQQSES